MQITINAFGTRGDVQPYIALGEGLKQSGHDVRLFTHNIFEGFVRNHDLEFYPMQLDPRTIVIQQDLAAIGNNPFKFMSWLRENYRDTMQEMFRETEKADRDADLIINSLLSNAGYHVAQKYKLPVLSAYLQPVWPSRFIQSVGSPPPPGWLPLRHLYNYYSSRFYTQMFFQLLRPLVNESRRNVLGIKPLSFSYYWGIDIRPLPQLYGYSPAVLPKPPDWGDEIEIAGYWFLDQLEGYQPAPELLHFLSAGPPPVYVGFGSMVDHERAAIIAIIVEALQKAECRGILLGGWAELGSGDLPDSIFLVDQVPHEWLFPQVAAVVHHGGAGTSAAGFRAGVPSITIPFFGDQFFWGWRASQLGVGLPSIPRKELTADKLAVAIRQALSDGGLRDRAEALGERIRQEDGVKRAVDYIENTPRKEMLVR
jgi:sterol 3beta-glucosyltransferase